MADNFIQPGDVLDTDNDSGSDVDAGGVLIVAGGIRIAINDIDDGDSGPAYDEGVFSLDAKTTDTCSDGDVLYWDATNEYLTTTADGNFFAGYAVGAKVSGDTSADVKLGKNCVATTTTAAA